MAQAIMVVASEPSELAREAEFNRWYDDQHIPDVLAVPGFVGARCYRAHGSAAATGDRSTPRYLAIYEIDADDLDADDLDALLAEFGARVADGRISISDAVRPASTGTTAIYVPIS